MEKELPKLLPSIENAGSEIQRWFESSELPSKGYWNVVWMLLTVCDDFLRLYRGATNKSNEIDIELNFNYFQSEMPYALKHAIGLANRKLRDTNTKINELKLVDKKMTIAFNLIKRSMDYESYWRCWNAISTGTNDWSYNPETLNYILAEENLIDGVIYYALNTADTKKSPYSYMHMLLLKGIQSGTPHKIALSASKRSGNKIGYIYNLDFAKQLSELVPQPDFLIGKEWIFPWANEKDLNIFHHALITRCIYHFVAVNYGAILLSQKGLSVAGYGVSNLCMLIKKEKLIQELVDLSGLERELVAGILSALIYGHHISNPDPALQPIFSPETNLFIIAPIFLSSVLNIRNALSLHSRVDPSSFNRQSDLFERRMIQKVQKLIPEKYSYRFGIRIPRTKLEVDLIIVDENSKKMMIGELKWFNNPGDIREVIDRKKAIENGITQIQARLNLIKESKSETLRDVFGIRVHKEKESDWDVTGILILDGYFAFPKSHDANIVIVPYEVFSIGIQRIFNLKHFYDWLSSDRWAPVERIHYQKEFGEAKVANYKFNYGTFSPLDNIANYFDFVQQSIKLYLAD